MVILAYSKSDIYHHNMLCLLQLPRSQHLVFLRSDIFLRVPKMLTCDLCNVSNVEFSNDTFFSISSCNVHHGQPLVVLKHHRSKLTPQELKLFHAFISLHYPGYVPRGIGMQSIKDHWHEHLIKRPTDS